MKRKQGWMMLITLAAAAIVLGGVAAGKGELELYLFLIVPFLRADGWWGAASLLLAFTAFIVLLLNLLPRTSLKVEGGRDRPSAGGVLLIGPIPIIFGTDRSTAIIVLTAAVAVLAALLLLLLL
ncbi:MAG: DUF131 domain-containing protein [Methanomassiliicoccales archaeon]|nr:DUF131 domain-containing protein [Methanomassiliicoccales archaeon]